MMNDIIEIEGKQFTASEAVKTFEQLRDFFSRYDLIIEPSGREYFQRKASNRQFNIGAEKHQLKTTDGQIIEGSETILYRLSV